MLVTVVNLCALVNGAVQHLFFFVRVLDGDFFNRGRSGVAAISKGGHYFFGAVKITQPHAISWPVSISRKRL